MVRRAHPAVWTTIIWVSAMALLWKLSDQQVGVTAILAVTIPAWMVANGVSAREAARLAGPLVETIASKKKGPSNPSLPE